MVASSFDIKQLRVTFTLANNSKFAGTNSNVLTLEGLRMIANIKSAGAGVTPALRLQVFGMRQSDMNALTMLAWKPLALQRNVVRVEANAGNGWVVVFLGNIIDAGPDYSSAPDVTLRCEGKALYVDTIQPAEPSSYTGPTQVSTICKDLAGQMGMSFEDNDVNATLVDPYLPNTRGDQLKTACDQANVDLYVDNDTIAITARGQPRRGTAVLLTPETGLVMTPTIDKVGIQLMTLFNPAIRFGGVVNVDVGDACPKANGLWYTYALDHNLESEKPGGAWFSYLSCSDFGRTVTPR